VQERLFDTGSPLGSKKLNALTAALHPVGVLSGFDVTVVNTEEISISAGELVLPSGILFRSTAAVPLDFTNPPAGATYTVAVRHTDGGLIGGNDATFEILSGKQETIADGTPIAFIKHPGGVGLTQAMVTPVVKTKLPDAILDVLDRRRHTLMPPFPGAVNVPIQAELTVAGATSDGDVTVTAVTPGTSAPRYGHVVAGNNTPLSVAVAGSDVTVNVATNASGAAISTAAQVVAAVKATPAAVALLTPAAGGSGAGVVGAAALASLTGGMAATGPNISVSQLYDRAFQRTALKVSVGAGAPGNETHVLLFRLLAHEWRPRKITFAALNQLNTTLAVLLRDTKGKAVTLTPSSFGVTTGWQDLEVVVGDTGTFEAGKSWFLQVHLTGPANSAMQIGAITVHYDPIELV